MNREVLGRPMHDPGQPGLFVEAGLLRHPQWPPIGPDVAGLATPIPARARWNAYQGSGEIASLFNNQ